MMASQALNITVSSPQKVGKGLFSYVTYRVYTCIGLDRMSKNEYIVYRRYREFRMLHEKLEDRLEGILKEGELKLFFPRYAEQCIILPPPPSKNKVKAVSAKMKSQNDTDGLGKSVGK